jgi:hypothetical protein
MQLVGYIFLGYIESRDGMTDELIRILKEAVAA